MQTDKAKTYGRKDVLKTHTVFFEHSIDKGTLDKLAAGVKKASGRVLKEYDPDTVTISICEHRAGFVYVDVSLKYLALFLYENVNSHAKPSLNNEAK